MFTDSRPPGAHCQPQAHLNILLNRLGINKGESLRLFKWRERERESESECVCVLKCVFCVFFRPKERALREGERKQGSQRKKRGRERKRERER